MDEQQLSRLSAKRKSKKLRKVLFSALVVVVLLSVLGVAASRNFFIVNELIIQETSLYSYETLSGAAGIEMGTPLVKVPRKRISADIEKEFDFLTEVKVSSILPDKISISFTEKLGELYILLGEETFVLDENLLVLARGDKTDVTPRIELKSKNVERCVVGEKILFNDSGMEEIVRELITNAKEAGITESVEYFDVTDKFNIKMQYLGRYVVLLGENEDIRYKIAMAIQVSKELSDENAGEIDLKNPNTAYVRLYN